MGHNSTYGTRFAGAGPEWIQYLEQLRTIKRGLIMKLNEDIPSGMAASTSAAPPPPLRLPKEPSTPGDTESHKKAAAIRATIKDLYKGDVI